MKLYRIVFLTTNVYYWIEHSIEDVRLRCEANNMAVVKIHECNKRDLDKVKIGDLSIADWNKIKYLEESYNE